ncbi:hypothetical protein [Rothia sp. P4278]|uniref:hypothetical protein n=1 Tax=Rothia sp. P4278 TaxID=3402658 RepID=UPI003AE09D5D
MSTSPFSLSKLIRTRKSPDTALKTMMPYCLATTSVVIVTHTLTVFYPWATMLIVALGTIAVLLLMLTHAITFGKGLERLRFGGVIINAFTYTLLTCSNLTHFAIDAASGIWERSILLATWGGPAVAMPVLWGLGLLIHMFAVIGSRGFEETSVLGVRKVVS